MSNEAKLEVKVLQADMGSCNCGDVYTEVVIDHQNKKVITYPHGYSWMSGKLRNAEFSVPYAGGFDLPSSDYVHEIRIFSDAEQTAIKNAQ